jgi:4-hydroxy-3-polyprenylbenzoate decarboxylase
VLEEERNRFLLAKEKRAEAKRKKLGLPGQIPSVRAFEEEKKVVYHEVGGFEPGKQPGEDKK